MKRLNWIERSPGCLSSEYFEIINDGVSYKIYVIGLRNNKVKKLNKKCQQVFISDFQLNYDRNEDFNFSSLEEVVATAERAHKMSSFV